MNGENSNNQIDGDSYSSYTDGDCICDGEETSQTNTLPANTNPPWNFGKYLGSNIMYILILVAFI
jgi:hypothetical protein